MSVSASQVFAERLKALMAERGLTQSSLARKTGGRVGQTTIGLYLDPARRAPTAKGSTGSPTLEKIEQVADALSVPWTALLGNSSQPSEAMMQPWPFGSFISQERWKSLTKEQQEAVVSAAVDKLLDVVSAIPDSGKAQRYGQT